jgi:3-oxoacyl-[acyl-carrier protein] reductase
MGHLNIRFDNQIVLITGASTGIGAAIARAFGECGASVVVHYNQSETEAQAVARDIEASGGKALLVQGDVTNAEHISDIVAKTLEAFGRIDILINNAGSLVQRSPIAEASDALYDRIMDLNTKSVFEFCKRVIPVMQQQGRGNIINMTSISGRNGGGGGSVLYSASKAAVSTLTRGLAKELAAQNIRVNAISPGVILTPFHDRYTEPERMQQLIKTIPMERAGTAEECTGTALFLASDTLSSYITGQIIEVNGGQLMP